MLIGLKVAARSERSRRDSSDRFLKCPQCHAKIHGFMACTPPMAASAPEEDDGEADNADAADEIANNNSSAASPNGDETE